MNASDTLTLPKVRRAGSADAPAIRDVYLAARLSAMPWLPLLYAPDDVLRWFETSVLPLSQVFVAEHKGEVIGFASLNGDMLDHLYIHPSAQRHGAGTALLEAVKNAARGERLRLYTFARNTLAHRFYAKHGFHQVGSSDGSRNEEGEPDILLELDIAQ